MPLHGQILGSRIDVGHHGASLHSLIVLYVAVLAHAGMTSSSCLFNHTYILSRSAQHCKPFYISVVYAHCKNEAVRVTTCPACM